MEKLRKADQILPSRAAGYIRGEITATPLELVKEIRRGLFNRLRHRQISDRAYELWEQGGRPMTGRDLDFWLAAEREIDAR
ncbi:DUF2934 domain-containing protein [Bradyrhizobium japonicum]|uniref:DUF2934 domain-containing protein n=1 Tax=Bradyrhizobium japonicum TaxID=375 RepID=UPI00339204ED